jgi:hypothetical protein
VWECVQVVDPVSPRLRAPPVLDCVDGGVRFGDRSSDGSETQYYAPAVPTPKTGAHDRRESEEGSPPHSESDVLTESPSKPPSLGMP